MPARAPFSPRFIIAPARVMISGAAMSKGAMRMSLAAGDKATDEFCGAHKAQDRHSAHARRKAPMSRRFAPMNWCSARARPAPERPILRSPAPRRR